MYNSVPGGMTAYQPWEMSGYYYGGMIYAALRGNADATKIIADHMAWIDKIANHSIQAGDHGGNGYAHFYRTYAMSHSQLVGNVSVGNFHGGAPLMTADAQMSGENVTFDSGSITGWVSNAGGGSAFTMNGTPKGPWYNPGALFHPQDNDAITIFVAQGLTIVNDGSQYPTELALNQTYYIRDLSPAKSSTGPWTFNLSATKGGAAIVIHSSNSSRAIYGLNENYISSNPDVLDSCGPDFLRQVGDTINWIHAVASNAKLNAIAGFT